MLPAAAALTPAYKRVMCPTAIIAGVDDQIVNKRQAERLKQALPHASITTVLGAGRMLHYLAPKEVAQAAGIVQVEAVSAIQ
jgi:pimeloyl-ACP methyl ester carboxylesterase